MKIRKDKKYGIFISFICAVVFFCVSMPLRLAISWMDITGVRIDEALPQVCGLLFGMWGAVGCAVGNFAADILSGTEITISIISFFIQVVCSYLVYVLWYGNFKEKYSPYPVLDRYSRFVKLGKIIFINAFLNAAMLGMLIEIYQYDDFFSDTVMIILFNNLNFGILFGMPLLTVLMRKNIPIITPSETPKKYRNPIINKIAFVIILVLIVMCFALKIITGEVSVYVMAALFVGVVLFVFTIPLKPVMKKEFSGIISMNEKMIFYFMIGGTILSLITAVVGVMQMSDSDYNVFQIWQRIYVLTGVTVNLYFIIISFILKYIEKNVTMPVKAIADISVSYDKENDSYNSSDVIKECKKLSENKTEIGEMADSICRMLEDIDIFTQRIKENTAEKERMKAELKIASKIQLGILPHNFDDFADSIEVFAYMKAAKRVGGDFYDFFRIDDENTAFVIGDVSGKGIPAAVFMSMTKSVIQMYSVRGKSPADTLTLANKFLCTNNSEEMFVTAFIAVINTKTGIMKYANAGHNPPVLYKNGKEFSLMKVLPGFMLGVIDEMIYKENEIQLESGDMLFLYTDGITEAENEKDELFGEQRLIQSLNDSKENSAKEILNHIKSTVGEFADKREQYDDMTMLLFKVK
ncbi:MAG: PP2C family protein-serine/threonine phosphatase [Clostridia bacterium]|nr:PP2C family protein-serine/threonine phosphatase [Clostridia bacterium]